MPRYDMKCKLCGLVVERSYSSAEEADARGTVCPDCGSDNHERLPSAPNFTVQGFNAKNGYTK